MPVKENVLSRDCQLVVTGGERGFESWPVAILRSLELTKPIRHTAQDGSTRSAELPEGWEFIIDLQRSDPAARAFLLADAEKTAGHQAREVKLQECITRDDQSPATFIYSGASLMGSKIIERSTYRIIFSKRTRC